MAYGMTPEGFIPKRLAEIQNDISGSLADIVTETGERPFLNATDDSILQQIVGVFSEALAECWNAAYLGSIQFDPLKNTGAGQSGTVQLNAMLRKPGTAAIIDMELTGTPGTLIPAGSQIGTADSRHIYATSADVILDAAGKGLVRAQALEKSDFIPELGTVVRILTLLPGGGWTEASNIGLVSPGAVEESDELLRMRQQRSTSLTSYRLIEAIYAAVMNVPGVIYCRAYQNSKVIPADERGIPFKEVAVVAEGGDPREIAEALFLRLPTGQIGYGNTTEVFIDKQKYVYPISFTRPVDVEIWVAIRVRITVRADFPDNALELMAQEIIDYAQYGGAGNNNGFPPGSDIILTRLYTPINNVAGHAVTSLLIGTSQAVAAQDIPIAWNEVARFHKDRISITIDDV